MGRFSFILLYLITTHKKGKRKPKKKKSWLFLGSYLPFKKGFKTSFSLPLSFHPISNRTKTLPPQLQGILCGCSSLLRDYLQQRCEGIMSNVSTVDRFQRMRTNMTEASHGRDWRSGCRTAAWRLEMRSRTFLCWAPERPVETDQVHSSKVKRISLAC